MDTRGGFTLHRTFILTLFILGNTIITFGMGTGVSELLVATVFSLVLGLLFNLVLKKITPSKLWRIVAIVLLPLLIYFFLDCCRDYVIFTDTTKMPNTSAAIIAVLFTVLSIYCGSKKREDILRLSIIIFIVIAIILLLLILFSLPLIKTTNIDWTINTNDIFNLFIKAFLPSLVAVYFIKSGQKSRSVIFFGLSVGAFFLLICLLLSHLVLANAQSIVRYSLATVGGTISIGKGFFRFEGFVYLFTMLTCFIKSSVIFYVIKKITLSLGKKFYIALLLILPILAALFSISRI